MVNKEELESTFGTLSKGLNLLCIWEVCGILF
ncbi:MAG: hypothetical protein PWP22_1059 [Thermoanaerobacter sp.]|jgi:hypothetical protein|nr:hypothetical protein [Thermoanaerobacter sp.]